MGIVMVISLLSVPQMTATLFVNTYRQMVWLSALLAYIGCVCGLLLSYYADVPGGACIIIVSIGIYAAARTIKATIRGLKKEGCHARHSLPNQAEPQPRTYFYQTFQSP